MKIAKNQIDPEHPLAPKSREEAVGRLLVLANHLEYPQGECHRRFDFDFVAYQIKAVDNRPGECGTVGCAVGSLPYCFPEIFKFDLQQQGNTTFEHNSIRPVDEHVWLPEHDHTLAPDLITAACFFGLDSAQTYHLFVADEQEPAQYGGCRLRDPSPMEVAENIRLFLLEIHPDLYTHEQHDQALESR